MLGSPGEYAVRPERLRIAAPEGPLEPGEVAAPGKVTEVVYLGPATHAIVALDAGPRLTVSRPNSGSAAELPLAASDRPVAVVFHRDSLIALSGGPGETEERA